MAPTPAQVQFDVDRKHAENKEAIKEVSVKAEQIQSGLSAMSVSVENIKGQVRLVEQSTKNIGESVKEIKNIVSDFKTEMLSKLNHVEKRVTKLENKFAIAIGVGTAVASVAHFIFDLISPWTKHLLDAAPSAAHSALVILQILFNA